MAQRTETTVTECFLTSCVRARFPARFPHYAKTAAEPAHSDSVESRVYACLGVTYHLHFWQNDRGLLLFFTCHCGNTGVERTPNKSQHTKLTLEKKIVPPLLPGFELATFQSQVRRSTNKLYRVLTVVVNFSWEVNRLSKYENDVVFTA